MMRLASLALIAAAPVLAGPPLVTGLQPPGAQLGRPFTLKAVGWNLGEGARVASTFPASFTLVAASQDDAMAAPGATASFLVEPKAGAKPGVYPIRIETATGISNVMLFSVGTFPEVMEEESQPYARPNRNDSIETAEPVRSIPVTVNGTLRGAERDVFRISGKAGERRVFEVEARRCGSAIDPELRILDASGKQLARADDSAGTGLDARLDFTFPAEGFYYVEVHDARFSTQEQNFYRLTIGSYPYADGLFPLGGRRGEQVPVTLFGKRLAAPVKTTADLRQIGERQEFTTVELPGSPALPMMFAVSDLPEVIEPAAGGVPVPGVINGRLEKPGEIDRYRLKVEPGAHLLLELQARELGTSRLEGILTVYDGAGKKLDSAGDKPLPEDVFAVQGTSRTSSDPFLNFTVPKDVREITVAVEDLAERGGPLYGYRLIVHRAAADFQISLNTPYVNVPAGGTMPISVTVDRRGYDGPIRLVIPNAPKGLTVEGGFIPREYVDSANTRTFNRRGVFTITAELGLKVPSGELQIWGEVTLPDGTVLRRRARGPGVMVTVAGATAQGSVDRQRPLTAPWLGMELPMAVGETAAATLEVRQTGTKHMDEGSRYDFEYRWRLRDRTMVPPKELSVDVIGARDIRVTDMRPPENTAAGDGALTGTFAVNTTKATDPARYDVFVSGRLDTEHGEELVAARLIPLEAGGGSSKGNVALNK